VENPIEYLKKLILRLKRDRLAREMEEGYRAEAASPSLDPEWDVIEVEEWEGIEVEGL